MANSTIQRVVPVLFLGLSGLAACGSGEESKLGAVQDQEAKAGVGGTPEVPHADPGPGDGVAVKIDPSLTRPCESRLPPTGSMCSCFYEDCAATVLNCRCAPDCWETESGCMINVPARGPVTSHPAIASCEIGCTWVDTEVSGEFTDPEHVACAVKNCTDPIPEPDPPARPPRENPPPDVPPPDVACPVPVPGPTEVAGPVWNEYNIPFYVPFAAYAFGTAHAWKLSRDSGIEGFTVVPSFLFSTALKESFMGCNNDLTHWTPGAEGILYRGANSVDKDGCFQIESTTALVEVEHHFPRVDAAGTHEALISSMNQDALGRDNFVSSAIIATYYYLWVYGMMTTDLYNIEDPSEWFSTASDPYAFEKAMALIYNRGAWGGAAVTACHDTNIEQCGRGFADYVPQIAGGIQAMEAELGKDNCYDEPITEADVKQYVAEVTVVWKDVDVPAVEAAAVAAFHAVANGATEVPFQKVAMTVLDAIDGVLQVKLACPQEEMTYWYGSMNNQCPAGSY